MHSPEYIFLSDGKYMLFKKRATGIDTYIKVDNSDNPVKEKQRWSNHPQHQIRLLKNGKNERQY